eukprot:7227288-Prymnesium_polylepis.1
MQPRSAPNALPPLPAGKTCFFEPFADVYRRMSSETELLHAHTHIQVTGGDSPICGCPEWGCRALARARVTVPQ